MFKTTAINMLGGTTSAAARAMGISFQAVDRWPPLLTRRIADRVLGVVARMRFPELATALAEPSEPAKPVKPTKAAKPVQAAKAAEPGPPKRGRGRPRKQPAQAVATAAAPAGEGAA